MEVLKEIAARWIQLFILGSGILGVLIFSLPFVSRDILLSLNRFVNQTYDIDTPINRLLNRLVPTESATHRNRVMLGILLTVGSVYFLVFVFTDDHQIMMEKILNLPSRWAVVSNIFYVTLILFSKLAGLLGAASGILLLFFPERLKRMEFKLNVWLSTEPLEDKWNETTKDIDSIFFLHPYLFGGAGLILSLILTGLAIANLRP